MTTLYWAPHTCAIGIHILLEEIGTPFEAEKLTMDELHGTAFQLVNPKGKVPALRRDDGSILTEFGVIAYWLAHTNAQAKLIPDDKEAETRGAEMMDYAVGTIHAQGFARIFLTERFEPQDMLHRAGFGAGSVRAQGREIAEKGFSLLDQALGSQPYAGGERFSIFDAALFYCERWAASVDMPMPPAVAGHFTRVRARPAVQRVLRIWGEPTE